MAEAYFPGHGSHIRCPPLILAPIVNMSKGGCENKSALFDLSFKTFTKIEPFIGLKELKVGVNHIIKLMLFSKRRWP